MLRIEAYMRFGKYLIRAYSIIGAPRVVVSVWEPFDGHGSMVRVEGETWGRVGTARLPKDLEAMPTGEDRYNAVSDWYRSEWGRAHFVMEDLGIGNRRDMARGELTARPSEVNLDPFAER